MFPSKMPFLNLMTLDGTLTFVSALDYNYVLDISNGKIVNTQNIQLYQSNGTNAQKFKLTRV